MGDSAHCCSESSSAEYSTRCSTHSVNCVTPASTASCNSSCTAAAQASLEVQGCHIQEREGWTLSFNASCQIAHKAGWKGRSSTGHIPLCAQHEGGRCDSCLGVVPNSAPCWATLPLGRFRTHSSAASSCGALPSTCCFVPAPLQKSIQSDFHHFCNSWCPACCRPQCKNPIDPCCNLHFHASSSVRVATTGGNCQAGIQSKDFPAVGAQLAPTLSAGRFQFENNTGNSQFCCGLCNLHVEEWFDPPNEPLDWSCSLLSWMPFHSCSKLAAQGGSLEAAERSPWPCGAQSFGANGPQSLQQASCDASTDAAASWQMVGRVVQRTPSPSTSSGATCKWRRWRFRPLQKSLGEPRQCKPLQSRDGRTASVSNADREAWSRVCHGKSHRRLPDGQGSRPRAGGYRATARPQPASSCRPHRLRSRHDVPSKRRQRCPARWSYGDPSSDHSALQGLPLAGSCTEINEVLGNIAAHAPQWPWSSIARPPRTSIDNCGPPSCHSLQKAAPSIWAAASFARSYNFLHSSSIFCNPCSHSVNGRGHASRYRRPFPSFYCGSRRRRQRYAALAWSFKDPMCGYPARGASGRSRPPAVLSTHQCGGPQRRTILHNCCPDAARMVTRGGTANRPSSLDAPDKWAALSQID
mmetsp:Transcript_85960/g.179732  ORF Transcript_85960/g.179732 Transcript_85960/m.179732 type:complete len:638 (-) Transcript_85960:413-2326(-)